MFLSRVAVLLMLGAGCSVAQQTDSSTIAADGTAYVTRVVPVPTTVSPEAQKMLAKVVSDANVPTTLEQRRAGTDKWQNAAGELSKKLYPANVQETKIAGVPVRVVTPLSSAADKPRQGVDQPAWRRVQLGFRITDRDDPDCQPDGCKGGCGVVSAGAGASVSCWIGRCYRCVQRIAEDVQAQPHWHLWNFGGSDFDGGGFGKTEAARIAAAGRDGDIFRHGRHEPTGRLGLRCTR